MDSLTRHHSGSPLRGGRRVAVRFTLSDQAALTAILNLFGSVQVAVQTKDTEQGLAYGWWAGSLEELDRTLRRVGVAGLALVGFVKDEELESAPQPAVQSWRVAVRFDVRNSPLFVYLTSVLAALKVAPEPYGEYLWIEGTFTGSLDHLKGALAQLQADDLRILNEREAPTTVVTEPVVRQVTVTEVHDTAPALMGPTTTEQRRLPAPRVAAPTRKSTYWLPALVGVLLCVVVVALAVFRAEQIRSLLFPPPPAPAPRPALVVDPETVPWVYLVQRTNASAWLVWQRNEGVSVPGHGVRGAGRQRRARRSPGGGRPLGPRPITAVLSPPPLCPSYAHTKRLMKIMANPSPENSRPGHPSLKTNAALIWAALRASSFPNRAATKSLYPSPATARPISITTIR